ncbi:MAG: NAD(+) diphosphatase [Candidatus Nanopelagicales bacterium]
MSEGSAIHDLLPALGHEVLDRRADLRTTGWAAVPVDRVMLVLDGAAATPVVLGPDGSMRLALADSSGAAVGPGSGADILLGVDPAGRAWCGRVVDRDHVTVAPEARWAGLREVALELAADQRGILAELVALANWHQTHVRCPRCGSPTEIAGLGWWRHCPQDGTEHYPRTDPAVIALLLDDGDNALLGRQTRWPIGAFSTLAGFVEPGESAESAVLREIGEEVGLRPHTTTYLGSQPWPFPASLMLGYHARIGGVRPHPRPDGIEIAEARWISRAELPALCESREVRLPGRLSIAHHLVRSWLGRTLPDEWCRW